MFDQVKREELRTDHSSIADVRWVGTSLTNGYVKVRFIPLPSKPSDWSAGFNGIVSFSLTTSGFDLHSCNEEVSSRTVE